MISGQQAKFQIGKNGITKGVIDSISLALKSHRQVRISCLKSSGRKKENMLEMAEELKQKIKEKTKFKIEYRAIGFTIILLKL